MDAASGDAAACGACRTASSPADRFCRNCGAVLSGPDEPGPDVRKTVTVVFIDLVGSTTLAEQLDPEVLRRVLGQYYQVCAESIAEYGGTIEKYIGDAVMAVFGVPTSHEDDAVRAVRAAWAAVQAVPGAGSELAGSGVELSAHAGVCSGEVVVILAPGAHMRIVGDTVNTAARLQGAATTGEVLVNAEVAQLISAVAELEPLPPLRLRGKAGPVPAWRLRSLAASARPADRAALVGRAEPLDQLTRCYQRTVRERCCHRAVISGPPGIGKSRLARELLRHPQAGLHTALTGQCQPYGKGMTFQPLTAMLRGSLAISSQDGWSQLLGTDGGGERAARTLAGLLSDTTAHQRTQAGVTEICWAASQLFAALARRHPLVLLWEDLHWAEPTLLRFVDDLADRLAQVPVLLLFTTRGDVPVEPARDRECRVRLAPLPYRQALELVSLLAGGQSEVTAQGLPAEVARIALACDGNPLFATVMADMLADDQPTEGLPPSIAAVLQARLDALPRAEHSVLQLAAVCGRTFGREQLAALSGQLDRSPDLGQALSALLRRDLLRRDHTGQLRFAETLIYDAAYISAAKAQRAQWHAALAAWPGGRTRLPRDRELYHAETGCLLYREISPLDPALPSLQARAVRLLTEEGTTALHRKDLDAAVALLRRALALADGSPGRATLVIRLCDALLAIGDSTAALAVLAEGDHGLAGPAQRRAVALQRAIIRLRLGQLDFGAARDEIDARTRELAGAPPDTLSQCLLHQLSGLLEFGLGHGQAAEAQLREALRLSVALDDRYSQDRLLGALCELAQWSPISVTSGLAGCAELITRFAADRLLLITVLTTQARLLALGDQLDTARATLATARQYATDMHATLLGLAVTQTEAVVESLDGEHAAAASRFATAAAELQAHGHALPGRTLEIYAIRETLRAGPQSAAAGAFAGLASGPLAAGLDVRARTWAQMLTARLAAEGELAGDGVALARDCLHGLTSDDPCLLGDAWWEYARILARSGQPGQAAAAATRAAGHFAAKGATRPARDVRAWAARMRSNGSGGAPSS